MKNPWKQPPVANRAIIPEEQTAFGLLCVNLRVQTDGASFLFLFSGQRHQLNELHYDCQFLQKASDRGIARIKTPDWFAPACTGLPWFAMVWRGLAWLGMPCRSLVDQSRTRNLLVIRVNSIHCNCFNVIEGSWNNWQWKAYYSSNKCIEFNDICLLSLCDNCGIHKQIQKI